MMLGFQDEFEYFECANCGCLQIAQIPENLARYYPEDYHAFVSPRLKGVGKEGALKRFLKRQRTSYFLHGKNPLGRLIVAVCGAPVVAIRKVSATTFWDWLRKTGVRVDSSILDVGCGNGHLLTVLQSQGFDHLTGIDPFIDRDSSCGAVRLLKREITDIEGPFDLVMLHHSLEHMADQEQALKRIYALLQTGGRALIRTPIAGTFAWKYYGANWVQLDPPRHLFVHTIESMRILSKKSRLQMTEVVFDSTEFQFLGSVQYSMGVPLIEGPFGRGTVRPGSPLASLFSEENVQVLRSRAAELNDRRDGDSACFYLRKTDGD